jgi:hypothetical protein
LVVGLGAASVVDSVVVLWPSGVRDVRRTPLVDRYQTFTEPR